MKKEIFGLKPVYSLQPCKSTTKVIPESLIPVLIHLWLKLSREFQNGYPQELLYSDGFETIAELWKDPREKIKVWQEWYKDEMFRY